MRTSLFRTAALALALAALPACGTSHLVRPVGRGNTRVAVSAGGPLVRFGGAPVPVPIAVVGVAHGLSDEADVHAELHGTAALFGIAGLSMGGAWHPVRSSRTALSLGGTLYGFGNGRDAVLFADVWLGASWRVWSWLSLGGGLHNGLRIDTTDAELRERFPWAPTPFAQLALRPGGGRVEFELEARWNAAATNGFLAAPNYYSVGPLGALGLLIGVTYQFEGAAR